jgi:glycosyltransferase involved in cell wall biosynthesis
MNDHPSRKPSHEGATPLLLSRLSDAHGLPRLPDTALSRLDQASRVRTPSTRVLVDLSHAADGYVGVSQDLRLIFAMLCGIPSIQASGLLMPTGRHDLPHVRPGRADAPALTAGVLHWMERNWEKPERRAFPFNLLQRVQTLRQLIRQHHQLLPVEDRGQLNSLWRVLFARTLAPDQRALVLAQSFFATDLSVSSIIDLCSHPPVPLRKRLAAHGFDAVLFCMPRPVRLPPGVRQIVRFHDAAPVTDTDTVVGTGWKLALAHSRLVRACAPDAIFVCNSPQSLDSLVTLDPSRAQHAVVIPCAVAPLDGAADGIDVCAVIQRHVTFRALGAGAVAPAGWLPPTAPLRYVLSVSTLEPRKNYPGLIRAWERVIARSDPDLRLVIVGGPGWRETDLFGQLRPGVASGRILHLQNLPREELQALMRGAACFAFPSFNEGFGYSPLEAMQAGAPCVVSDLPVFRSIFGDSAIYVDPYDTDAIATGIERLTTKPGSSDLVTTLRSRSARVLARFRPDTVAAAWETLLDSVRRQDV